MSYFRNLFVSCDQLLNTVFGGDADLSISARIGYLSAILNRYKLKNPYWSLTEKVTDWIWEPPESKKHCQQAYLADPDEDYHNKNWLPFLFGISIIVIIVTFVAGVILHLPRWLGLARIIRGPIFNKKEQLCDRLKRRWINGVKKFKKRLQKAPDNRIVRKAIIIDMLHKIFGHNQYIGIILENTNLVKDEVIYFKFVNISDSYIIVFPDGLPSREGLYQKLGQYKSTTPNGKTIITDGHNWELYKINGGQDFKQVCNYNIDNINLKKCIDTTEGLEVFCSSIINDLSS